MNTMLMRAVSGLMLITSAHGVYVKDALAEKSAVSATADAVVPASTCNVVNISVSFSFDGANVAATKNQLDDRLFKLNGFLLQQQITKLETLFMCYQITGNQGEDSGTADRCNNTNTIYRNRAAANANSRDTASAPITGYKITGSAEYQIDSSDAAFKIGQFFTQQKFVVTVSNKQAKSEQCNAPVVTKDPKVAAQPKPQPQSSRAWPPEGAGNRAYEPENSISKVLKDQPPQEKMEEQEDYYSIHNGPTPDLPDLYQNAPEAQPLNK
jgi:hypothetical protein